jgi:hypothetical protein
MWESLLAIADIAGEHWPKRARDAAVALVAATADHEPSLGIRLLSDLQNVFGNAAQMTTATILEGLHGIKEAPWSDLKGKPLNDRGLAVRLRQYGVRSKDLNVGGDTRRKGYAREDLHDAWETYLTPPPPPPDKSATSATNATKPDFQGSKAADVAGMERSVADSGDEKTADKTRKVADVALVAGYSLSNTHAGPRPTPYKRATPLDHGGYAVPHMEWRTHGRIIRYSLLICSAQKTASRLAPGWRRTTSSSNANRQVAFLATGTRTTSTCWRTRAVVGRIFQVHAAPVGMPWMWTLAFGHPEDRTPTLGYAAKRVRPRWRRSPRVGGGHELSEGRGFILRLGGE